jgi:sugar (pentulose or hexulose) kinase
MLAAAAAWVRLGPVVEPDPARHDTYGEVYDIFRDGYPSLQPTFSRLAALGARQVPSEPR